MRIYERVKEGEVESEVKYKKGNEEDQSRRSFFCGEVGGGAPTCPPLFSLSLSLSRSFLPVLLFLLWVYLS